MKTPKKDDFYKYDGKIKIDKTLMPDQFPYPDWFEVKEDHWYHQLTPVPEFEELKGKLVIDWGGATTRWYQYGKNEKKILIISSTPVSSAKAFPGYDNVKLSFNEMQDIINYPTVYTDWHTALSSVNGVYLIVDTNTGDRYIGSAYGQEGILGRWTTYANDPTGGNKKMIEFLKNNPGEEVNFQYCILQILSSNCTNDEVIKAESLWKDKLMTRQFGLNDN